MLNKKEIIKILDEYKINKEEIIIISGAAMVLRDIKSSTSDIDFSVSPEYEKFLLSKYNCSLEKTTKDGINIWYIDNLLNFSTNYYKTVKYDNLFGFNVQIPEDILNLKNNLNREKDISDEILIKKSLKKKGNIL